MLNIKDILKHKVIQSNIANVRINSRYETAHEFATYVNLDTIFIMGLFKKFGVEKVLNCRSFIKDCPSNKKKALIWRLQNGL